MNTVIVLIIAAAVALIGLLILPRIRGFVRAEKTTVERRSAGDRRRRRFRVPVDRRRRNRRSEDAARAFVDNLSN